MFYCSTCINMKMMLDEETGVNKQDGGGKEESVSLIIKPYRTCNNFMQLACRAQQHMCNILYKWDRSVKKHETESRLFTAWQDKVKCSPSNRKHWKVLQMTYDTVALTKREQGEACGNLSYGGNVIWEFTSTAIVGWGLQLRYKRCISVSAASARTTQ